MKNDHVLLGVGGFSFRVVPQMMAVTNSPRQLPWDIIQHSDFQMVARNT